MMHTRNYWGVPRPIGDHLASVLAGFGLGGPPSPPSEFQCLSSRGALISSGGLGVAVAKHLWLSSSHGGACRAREWVEGKGDAPRRSGADVRESSTLLVNVYCSSRPGRCDMQESSVSPGPSSPIQISRKETCLFQLPQRGVDMSVDSTLILVSLSCCEHVITWIPVV